MSAADTDLMRHVLQTGLEVEMADHLGYERGQAPPGGLGNARNGAYDKTVTTEIGEIDLRIPRDRQGTFEPTLVPKFQRRLDGLASNVISLYAKGLTTGDIQQHLLEIYGSRGLQGDDSKITDQIVDEMIAWQSRPLDPLYAVLLIETGRSDPYALTAEGQVLTVRGFARAGASAMLRGVSAASHIRRSARGALRAWLVEREVALGWTAVLVPIPIVAVLALGSYTGGVLPWLHGRFSFGWFVVLALSIVAFSGAYAASEPGPLFKSGVGWARLMMRVGGARLLALAAFFFCLYLVSVLAWYVADPATSRLAGEATWWGVPLAVCFWTLAAVEIASETERSGSGEPADPARQWPWLVVLRRSRLARRAGYLFLFAGAVVFAALGSLPGVVWRRARDGEVAAWRGHGYVTTAVYNYGVTVWAGALLITASVFLAHGFRARPLGLRGAVLRRAWYSLWASAAVVVLMVCFGLSAQGWLAEPLVDVAMASYALCFAVMLVDASAATRHRRVRSSPWRRVVAAGVTIGFSFALVLIVAPALGLFRSGLLSAAVAALVPLIPTIHRALFGIQRRPIALQVEEVDEVDDADGNLLHVPIPIDPDEREALYSLLTGNQSPTDEAPGSGVIRHWQRCLRELATVTLPEVRNAPTSHPLVSILVTLNDGLERTKRYPLPEQLGVLLELMFSGDLDEQCRELTELMRRTSERLSATMRDTVGPRSAPRAMEMLDAECIARLPRLPDDADERERWQRLRDMRREWLFGNAEMWTGALAPIERSGKQGKYHKRHGTIRSQLLATACDRVLSFWLTNLENAPPRPPRAEPHGSPPDPA